MVGDFGRRGGDGLVEPLQSRRPPRRARRTGGGCEIPRCPSPAPRRWRRRARRRFLEVSASAIDRGSGDVGFLPGKSAGKQRLQRVRARPRRPAGGLQRHRFAGHGDQGHDLQAFRSPSTRCRPLTRRHLRAAAAAQSRQWPRPCGCARPAGSVTTTVRVGTVSDIGHGRYGSELVVVGFVQ